MNELRIHATLKRLDEVQSYVHSKLDGIEVSQKTMNQIDIVVEEIYVNIAHYAYAPHEGDAVIWCGVIRDKENLLSIRFEDWGKPFNPLEKEEADITLPEEQREIGGLGIYMVKRMMDKVEYRYEDGKNILCVEKII